jgi:hypothetical protein
MNKKNIRRIFLKIFFPFWIVFLFFLLVETIFHSLWIIKITNIK